MICTQEGIDTTTAAGKMVFRMLAVLAEFERHHIAERTKGALSHMRNEGKLISGRLPYGYDLAIDGENLLPNPEEQAGLQVIQRLHAKELGRRKIAAALSNQGIVTKTGQPGVPKRLVRF